LTTASKDGFDQPKGLESFSLLVLDQTPVPLIPRLGTEETSRGLSKPQNAPRMSRIGAFVRMKRLLIVGSASLLVAACAASAAGTPTPQLFSSPTPPVSGKPFPGLALVLPAEAQNQWLSFKATCLAWAAGRRIRGTATAVPRESAVPYAVVCSWKVPLRTTGKVFWARVATDVVWLDETLEHDQGQLVKWTIQRR
jgi:hypothetical protein